MALTNRTVTRRSVLKGSAGVAGLAASSSLLGTPLLAQERTLKIGSYGGYFEDSFKSFIYPGFTEATGITIESVTQPNSADWLVTMQQAASAGTVPADLSLYARETMIKASRIGGLLAPLDLSGAGNTANLDPYFLFTDTSGILGVGAMSWFTSMVVNPEVVEVPDTWAAFWDTEIYEQSLGLSVLFNSNLLDIIAATFFDGPSTFDTNEGVEAMIAKAAELKPNVALWWSAESQMEQAMKNTDVIGGMYFHDVAGLMAADGFPIASVFPKEGNPIGYGSWCLSAQSEKSAEALEFINYSSDAATQAAMSLNIGTAPLVSQELAGLTDEVFASVSGSPVIQPNYEAYLDNETFIKETWEKMLAEG